ncbi:hypothetical protein SAMN04487769_0015 [Burkholderia sp. b14]|nr:hypothetical protein SAMN04487769_0015 [Burkholderia sp. b14]
MADRQLKSTAVHPPVIINGDFRKIFCRGFPAMMVDEPVLSKQHRNFGPHFGALFILVAQPTGIVP